MGKTLSKDFYTASREDYLVAVYILQKEKREVRSVDVAEMLGYSRPSACNALGLLRKNGLLRMEEGKALRLTEEGEKEAGYIYQRYLTVKNFLTKILEVSPETARRDTCRIEHLISGEVCRKMREYLEKNGYSIEEEAGEGFLTGRDDRKKKLSFRAVERENRRAVESLSIFPEQAGFIETVGECLAEADEERRWRPVGIYDGETLIGFAMYGFFEKEGKDGRAWLDRLLIDRSFQGKSYGKAAVLGLLEVIRREYGRPEVYLSVYGDNPAAIHLYEELGFRFNGELDAKGERIMVQKF